MSSSWEYNSAKVVSKLEEEPNKEQPSQLNLEQDSESESGSEGRSLESVVTRHFYPWFSTPHNLQKPYFLKRNFKGPEEASKVINERFHINKVHQDIFIFPNLADNYIYKYTFLHPHLFITLQWKLDQQIANWNALCRNQYAFKLCYSMTETHSCLLQTIL